MENLALKPIYEEIWGEKFNYKDFRKRNNMQRCMYLATELGLNVGDYYFSWFKHGPYSVQLDADMKDVAQQPEFELAFSEQAEMIIKKVKKVVAFTDIVRSCEYTTDVWLECVASIHYLNRVFHGDKKKVYEELQKRSPHMNSARENERAYKMDIAITTKLVC